MAAALAAIAGGRGVLVVTVVVGGVLSIRTCSRAVPAWNVDPSAQPTPLTATVWPWAPSETVTTSPFLNALCRPACVTVTVNDCGAAVPKTAALLHA